jgi:Ni/Co efflux regulator RcnB
MNNNRRLLLLIAGTFIFAVLALVLANSQNQPAMAGMDHSKMDMPQGSADAQEMDHTMDSMSNRHMDMGPHMKMTQLRPPKPGDQERADKIVAELRQSIAKYQDYHAALDDGYQIFMPNVKKGMKHFTNWRYAAEAQFRFDPDHPTSLLYEQHGDSYQLIGAMYTAPKRFTEDDLDKRIPLSVAQWHEHVNLCRPPKGQEWQMLSPHARFGPAGSITTKEECEAAGGTFYPIIYNWMVHVYPFEKNPQDVWSMERQMPGHHHAD